MPRRNQNTQLFALREAPAETLILRRRTYRLVRVFKHDFFAATCLYQTDEPEGTDLRRVVVKYGRTQEFWGFPLAWYGRWLLEHEQDIYRHLVGVPGVPRWVGCVNETSYAIEYIDAVPLDHLTKPPPGFFDRLRKIFDDMHARGVAYCDANKRSNILVDDQGRPFVIDFQISIHRRDRWIWPLRVFSAIIVRRAQEADLYHLYKHKRRLAPAETTPEEQALAQPQGKMHALHRKLSVYWRDLRRWFLRGQHQSGRLKSPTQELEDHDQPEKDTWRTEK